MTSLRTSTIGERNNARFLLTTFQLKEQPRTSFLEYLVHLSRSLLSRHFHRYSRNHFVPRSYQHVHPQIPFEACYESTDRPDVMREDRSGPGGGAPQCGKNSERLAGLLYGKDRRHLQRVLYCSIRLASAKVLVLSWPSNIRGFHSTIGIHHYHWNAYLDILKDGTAGCIG